MPAWNWSFIRVSIRQLSNRNTRIGVLIGRVSAMRYSPRNSPTRSLPQAINLLIESHRSIERQFHKHFRRARRSRARINLIFAARKPFAVRDPQRHSARPRIFRRRGAPDPSAKDRAAARRGPQTVRMRWPAMRVQPAAAAHGLRAVHTIPGRARIRPRRLHSNPLPGRAPQKTPRGRDRAPESQGPSLLASFSSQRLSSLFALAATACGARRSAHRHAHFQLGRQRSLDAQHHRQNRLAADGVELFAVSRRMIGPARAPVLRCVNVQESRHHLVALKRRQQHHRGFSRAHYDFSWTVRHTALTCTRNCAAPQQERRYLTQKKRPGDFSPGLVEVFILGRAKRAVFSERDPPPADRSPVRL